jgi:hypothetical protein
MLINPSTDARGAEEVTEGNWSIEKKCMQIEMPIYKYV